VGQTVVWETGTFSIKCGMHNILRYRNIEGRAMGGESGPQDAVLVLLMICFQFPVPYNTGRAV